MGSKSNSKWSALQNSTIKFCLCYFSQGPRFLYQDIKYLLSFIFKDNKYHFWAPPPKKVAKLFSFTCAHWHQDHSTFFSPNQKTKPNQQQKTQQTNQQSPNKQTNKASALWLKKKKSIRYSLRFLLKINIGANFLLCTENLNSHYDGAAV